MKFAVGSLWAWCGDTVRRYFEWRDRMKTNMQGVCVTLRRWGERILPKLMMIFLVLTVTSASFCGFFSKWSFRDGSTSFGIEAVLDETAKRPFVYRQLLPQTAKFVRAQIPEQTQQKLVEKLEKQQAIPSIYARAEIRPDIIIEYYLIYIFCFLSFFASIWILRSILNEVLDDSVAGSLTALLFALITPYFETLGGYFYDFPELMFFFLAVRFALHGRWLSLLIMTPFAAWNKESFFFFLMTLYPLHQARFGMRRAAALTTGSVFIAGVAYLFVHFAYAGNPGGTAEIHFFEHVEQFFSFKTYWYTSTTYGMPLGAQMFLPHVLYVVWIACHAWKSLSPLWRMHAKIAAGITIPLYWMFCAVGELRNLSFLYVAFAILTGFYIQSLLRRAYQSKETD